MLAQRANGVVESCVSRAGINQMSHGKLFDPAKPLKNGCVDELGFLFRPVYEAMDRISYFPGICHLHFPCPNRVIIECETILLGYSGYKTLLFTCPRYEIG